MIQQYYCQEKLDADHSLGFKGLTNKSLFDQTCSCALKQSDWLQKSCNAT